MECPRCASDRAKVIRTKRSITVAGKYSPHTDVREQICEDCGKLYKVECRITHVSVLRKKFIKQTFVPIEEYAEAWLDTELTLTRQEGLFDE